MTSWPSQVSLSEKSAFIVAMNISGSFEFQGDYGWSNLTNNFDGQGLSFGLLNQTLGTGSLEPLWLDMLVRAPKVLAKSFSPAHLSSLQKMLMQWRQERGSQMMAESAPRLEVSPLDLQAEAVSPSLGTPETNAVKWARQNLYVSSSSTSDFKPQWQSELVSLGQSPEYISLQVAAAWKLHERAVALVHEIGITELRAYLLMFDFLVQDGSYKSSDLSDYQNWLAANPSSSVTERLNELLALRLRSVKPEWRADIRARKSAIIQGKGTVHGDQRNLESEYCFQKEMVLAL